MRPDGMTQPGQVLSRLSPPEVAYAMALAMQRDACKGDRRHSRYKQSISGFGVHFAGVIGEVCFRKVHGGRLNTEVLPDGDRHRPDVILTDGRKVEVKTSLFQGSKVELKFERDELDSIDWCCLVQVTMPDTGLVFPVWSSDYIKARLVRKDYGYGERFVMAVGDATF